MSFTVLPAKHVVLFEQFPDVFNLESCRKIHLSSENSKSRGKWCENPFVSRNIKIPQTEKYKYFPPLSLVFLLLYLLNMPVEGFKVDVEKAVGHQFPSEKVVCNRRDFLIYALGVGVKEDELKYLYELGKLSTNNKTTEY